MLFNSIEYFVFLFVLLIVYWSSPHRYRNIILTVASLLFYAYWSLGFLLHYVAILGLNYPLLRLIIQKKSKPALVAALILDFGNLIFFKYFYFLIRSFDAILPGPPGLLSQVTPENPDIIPIIILPLAISFYTFQIVAFHLDAIRGEVTEVPGFWKYFLFISYFPQHIAGPIIRHHHLLKQLDEPRDPAAVDVERGLGLIAMGLIKKMLIADFFAQAAFQITRNPEKYDPAFVVLGSLFFVIQVYSDFSGYSDMARGSSILLGFELPVNFRGPLFQLSYQEHWQRWHITLSYWLRDYLYISLGGNRAGRLRSHFNLFLTFILGGLWHGAGWGFVIWGVIVGSILVIERILRDAKLISVEETWGRKMEEAGPVFFLRTLKNTGRALLIFTMVMVGGLFFNAGLDLDIARRNLEAVFFPSEGTKIFALNSYHAIIFAAFLFLHWLEYLDFKPLLKRREKWKRFERPALAAGAIVLLFVLSWKALGNASFVYFQF